MGNYDGRLRRLEEQSSIRSIPTPITRFLHPIIDPDPAIGVVSMLAMDSADPSREYREFERAADESVEDLERRVHMAMGWTDDTDPR